MIRERIDEMVRRIKQEIKIEENKRKFRLFNKKEIEKATKHINNEM